MRNDPSTRPSGHPEITAEDEAVVWAALRAAGMVWRLDQGALFDEPLGPSTRPVKRGEQDA